MNLGTLLPRHARFRPDHTAIIFEDQRLTYAQFHRSVNRLANALLNLGITKGRQGRHHPAQLPGTIRDLLGRVPHRGRGSALEPSAPGKRVDHPVERFGYPGGDYQSILCGSAGPNQGSTSGHSSRPLSFDRQRPHAGLSRIPCPEGPNRRSGSPLCRSERPGPL